MTVQNLTNGAFKKSMLMGAVAFGVAIGIMLGVLKLIFDFHIMYILIPGYTLGLILTLLSTEEFVNVGWDSAGVTTGPVTVPLVLAMGLGFGNALGSTDGFGILAAATGTIGAYWGGALDSKYGSKFCISFMLGGLVIVTLVIFGLSRSKFYGIVLDPKSYTPDIIFYIAGGLLGFVSGPIQSASRKLLVFLA